MAKSNSKKYSQLKATLAITKASLLSITRNPSTVVFSLVFPFIFILVFGFLGNRSIDINVAVAKDTAKDTAIYQSLEQMSNINLITDKSEDEVEKELKKGKIDALIDVKKSNSGSFPLYTVDVTTSSASPEAGSIFKSIINGMSDKLNLTFADIKAPAVSVNNNEIVGREFKQIDFILPGQLGFSLLSIGVFGTAFVLISLRNTLVLKRFFATPISRTNILLGEGISRLIFGTIQGSIIILVGALFLNYTLIHGFWTLLSMLLLVILGIIVFMGFGFIISSVAKDENAVPPLANLITMPQFLLAGTFFPIESFPKWLQPVSNILPLTYLNDAMRKVAFEGAPLTAVAREILILIIWGIIVYVVAARMFKWGD